MYYKLQANFLFDPKAGFLPKGIVVLNEEGMIVEIAKPDSYAHQDLQHYKGILCPGLVNSHCHIELSHLKGKLTGGNGLVSFLAPINTIRNTFEKSMILSAMEAAEEEMYQNGIVAVGDISNEAISFDLKAKRRLYYHTYIELFGLENQEAVAEASINKGKEIYAQLPEGLKGSLTPHAPYTVSPTLYHKIDAFNRQIPSPTSIHNQESLSERELFMTGRGAFYDLFLNNFNVDLDHIFDCPKSHSIQYTLGSFPSGNRTLLVHNTFTTAKDIAYAHQTNDQIYWCFCPNANLYIENALPNFELFRQANARITVGTDSYGSNWQLCILEELKVIQKHAPQIPLEELLTWATINGADFMGISDCYGSLEVGKSPGIVLLENVDLENKVLRPESRARRLM